ncbi:MAG: hypothetical protein AB1758_05730 [Candidatus Eremiobacterota bacterium]
MTTRRACPRWVRRSSSSSSGDSVQHGHADVDLKRPCSRSRLVIPEQSRKEEAAIDRRSRLQSWTYLLQDAERLAAERKAQIQNSVERLAEGMKASAPGVLLDHESLRVGGVRLKRKHRIPV